MFLSETVIVPKRSCRVFEQRGSIDCDGVLPTAVPVDSCGSELATRRAVFSKSWRSGELYTVHIKRDAGGGLRG